MRNRSQATSITLSVGVAVSFVLLIIGIVEELLHPGSSASAMLFGNRASILPSIARGEPIATLHLGLLVLMLTPLTRVVVLIIEFARHREFSFVAISTGVLFLLMISVVVGLG